MRLFIATPVSPELRVVLSNTASSLRSVLGGVRIKWVAPENLHLTFRFLGETPEAAVGELMERLRGACQKFPPMTVHLGSLGCFPDRARPRVIWVGLVHTSRLSELSDAVDHATAGFGAKHASAKTAPATKPETFSAHLTLGRLADVTHAQRQRVSQEIGRQAVGEPASWRIDRVVLMQSQLTPSGPLYRELGPVELCAGA